MIGDFLLSLLGVATAVARGQDDLVRQALILPLYWLLMSLAGYMAVMDLVRRPHHWQKTEHGLGSVTDEPLRTVGLVEHSHP